jgi:putative DNA primase/helicase
MVAGFLLIFIKRLQIMCSRLFDGEYQSEKCISESEKDLALMGKLLYWCSDNSDAAIEAFTNSPYTRRPKYPRKQPVTKEPDTPTIT